MSVLKHYGIFFLLLWAVKSEWLDGLSRGGELDIIFWVLGVLLIIAVGMTVYVVRIRKKGRKKGDSSPLL